jgi:hypothetical protein
VQKLFPYERIRIVTGREALSGRVRGEKVRCRQNDDLLQQEPPPLQQPLLLQESKALSQFVNLHEPVRQ